MANPRITAELYLKLHQQQVVTDLSDALLSGTDKAMRQAQKTISNAWRDAVLHGLTSGKVGEAQKALLRTGVVEAGEQYKSLLSKAEREHASAMRALEGERDDKVRTRLKREADATRSRTMSEASEAKKILDERASAYKKELDLQHTAAKEQRAAAKNAAESLEGAAEGLRGALGGGIGGMVRGLKGLGQRAHAGGESKIDAARELGAKGADPKMVAQMAKMGRVMAGIGTAVASVAAVIGVVVVLVKLFADLESKVKDMNKALIGTAGAADFGMTHGEIVSGKLAERIEQMRHDTTELNKNFMRFRVTFKEQQQILSQFNQAGYTFAKMNEEIKAGASHLKSFSDATALAITYSRNLGVSTGEISEKMGQFTFETGMGLQDIAEQFSVITREAMVAGFATKRFYSTIVEVTSGMAYYGVRIDETAKLLKTFDSLLGEAVGTEAFKKIVGQYKDKGPQDRIRELILKDQKFAQEQFAKAFERQIRNLAKTGDKLGLSEKDMRELLNMDEVAMSAQLQQRGAGPEQIQEFRRARLTGRAAGGDMGAMTRAMPFAGAGFDVAMASQGTEVFGGKRIDEVLRDLSEGTAGAAELAGLVQVTGKSLDELEKLGGLFTDMEAAMSNLRDIAKVAPDERTEAQKKLLVTYGKELGLFIDKQTGDILKGEADDQGRLIAGTEAAVKDALEAVSETTTLGEDQIKEQLTKDQEIATEISRNVTGMTEVLEQTTNRILERIYEAVMVVVDFLASDEKKQWQAVQLKGAHSGQKQAQQEAETKRKELAEAQRSVSEARVSGDEDALEAAQKNLEAVEKESLTAEKEAARTTVALQAVQNMSDEARGGMGVGSKEIVAAIDRSGEDIGGHRQKSFASALDRSLDRQQTKWALLDPSSYSLENIGDEFINELDAVTTSLEDLSGETRSKLRETGTTGQVRGGEATVGEAIQLAEAAFKEAGGEDWFASEDKKQAAIEAYNAAISEYLSRNIKSDADLLKEQQEQTARTEEIVKSFSEGDVLGGLGAYTGIAAFLGNMRSAKDLVIPAGGGKPILTDEKDTLMAFQPGGPISQAMGSGAGGGGVNINIYGGDQKKVYDTVMKALKAIGRA